MGRRQNERRKFKYSQEPHQRESIRSKSVKVCLLGIFLCLFSVLSVRADEVGGSNGTMEQEKVIQFWSQSFGTDYETRDVTYPKEAEGFDSSGVYHPRKKVEKENSDSFCNLKDGIMEVKSKVWKEAAPDPFYAYYQNTTEFYWQVENGDYDVSVTLTNQTLNSYDAFLRSGSQTQSKTKRVYPGADAILEGQISVADGELSLSILADSDAESFQSAKLQSVYVKKIEIKKIEKNSAGKTPVIYIAGDSTAAYYNSSKAPWEGWGQEFYRYFNGKNTLRQKSYEELGFNTDYLSGYREYKMKDITIENWAVPGESTKTFLQSGKWDGILNKVRPGDYVFVQFGHNDSVKSKGIKYADLTEYRANLNLFAQSCKQRDAQCVFLSSIPKYKYSSSDTRSPWVNSYRTTMKSTAAANGIPFLDIGSYGASFLTNIGKTAAKPYYLIVGKGIYPFYPKGKTDYIHLQKRGAEKFAQIVAARIKKEPRLRKLATYLNENTNYYKGITKTISFTKIKKSGRKTHRFYWKKVKYARYYKIYIYNSKKKSYRYIAKRYGTKAKIVGYSTRKKYKFRVRAVY